MNKQLVWAVMLAWVSLVTASFLWNWQQVEDSVVELARMQAVSHFEKDVIYRRWVSLQGGVYVPPTEKTPPNPYLAYLKDRDVTTASGKTLTLVNPAHMNRQVYELAAEGHGVLGHITSLKPLRPENAPDAWERRALRSFETGAREAFSLEHMGSGPYLRFMRPLPTEASCLKCHAAQGFKIGDVHGGISVSVPFAPFAEIAEMRRLALLFSHGLIGILGLAGLWLGGCRLQRSENALRQSLNAAKRMANFDRLTDLPNRNLFYDRLALALALAQRESHTGALLFLDLDRFKEVNDRLGHDAGDLLLKAVAGRLRDQARASDTLARLGGDEFTVILPHVETPQDASLVAEKIIAAISEPFDLNGEMASVGVSIGIALFPEHGDSVEEILKASDRAMYLAKDAGRNTYRFHPEGDANWNRS